MGFSSLPKTGLSALCQRNLCDKQIDGRRFICHRGTSLRLRLTSTEFSGKRNGTQSSDIWAQMNTGFWIKNDRIYGPDCPGSYRIVKQKIVGPNLSGEYYIESGAIFGPRHPGKYRIQGRCICGPKRTLPWLDH